MPEFYGWLKHFEVILALISIALWLVAPKKRLLSLLLLIYAVAMVFIADEVRAEYGRSDLLYSILDVSAGLAIAFIILLLLVQSTLRLGLIPWVHDREARSEIADTVYWFLAGCVVPLVLIDRRIFARFTGTILVPVLVATAIVALAFFVVGRRHGLTRNPLLVLPGYTLGMLTTLAASLFYGAKVSSAALALAQGAPYCVLSGSASVASILNMTPLTLISREISEYHGELIVERAQKPLAYNWSWKNLSFSQVPPDKIHSDECPKV